MLICENKDGLIIGHQCGYHLPRTLEPSVFNTMLNNLEELNNANDIIKLLYDTIQNSYKLPYIIAYHYLPANILLKIIENSENNQFSLRFTNVDYMNDTTDGKHGHSEFYTAIKYSFKKERNNSELLQELQKELYNGFSKLFIKNSCTRNENSSTLFMVDGNLYKAYVCSLSLDSESLPLWRTYGGGFGESYAIGLNTHYLTDICVCRIEYSNFSSENRFFPVKIIDKIINECNNGTISKSDIQNIVYALTELSSAWSISRKEYVWAYEKEIRLVKFMPVGSEPDGYSVRDGVFRPYINVKFDNKYLQEVIVGPMVERSNAAISIDEYMSSKRFGGGREKLQVRCSVLPVRF